MSTALGLGLQVRGDVDDVGPEVPIMIRAQGFCLRIRGLMRVCSMSIRLGGLGFRVGVEVYLDLKDPQSMSKNCLFLAVCVCVCACVCVCVCLCVFMCVGF